MKLQVIQEDLSKALSLAGRFVNQRAQLPILGNILLSAKKTKLSLLATNLEVSLALSIGARVETEGEITIPARTAIDLFSSLPAKNITLESDKEQLKISSEGFSGTISGMNSSEFPSVPQVLGKLASSLPKDKFLEAANQVVFAASNDETRPVLMGILFLFDNDNLVLISTDGFRLSQKKVSLDKKVKLGQMIIPKNSLSELIRIGGSSNQTLAVESKSADNQVLFGLGSVVLTTRVIEGEFPDFERIIPKESPVKVFLNREDFLSGIKTASVFARDSANIVKLIIQENGFSISAESSKSGKEAMDIEAKIEGLSASGGEKVFEISYNFRFVEEFLNNVKGEEVQMEFSNSSSPGVFRDSSDTSFLHLIMPVKIN
ncbi:MAG: polymerase III subunit beta, DNA polymerase III subunit beta protein [Candidatus Woesebacteria bacterium GW2011_GWC1_43_10b]|uniref:Beta sliding clamp n=1 Tax=Candidatus Woesebacteria bacterium GW2011_GWC1_43_10b TaxID=1618585 RepID=A0A0G1ECC5_9BACT|nr:MAG: polymerase III subunit beta, DNA polymerase III subunit beta protein [Candidatus Woesebacteria bacterium GW2011_GWC1_43_10b]